jgi:hypothetical protein
MQASMLAGLFAGLGGFAVLALHCPILTAPHVWAWHLGAMLIAGAGGAAAGVIVSRTGSQASISRAR